MTGNPTFLGSTAGITTAVLAVAAHGVAGGGVPTGPAAALLLAIAAGVGVLGAHVPSLSPVALLAVGQAGTHVTLTTLVGGHAHLSLSMFAAHVVAVAGCTALLAAAARFYATCGSALRCVWVRLPAVETPAALVPRTSTGPLVWGRAPPAISRRGPPVVTVRP